MKNDTLYDYLKSQLEKGITADNLFDTLKRAESDYNVEQEKKEKEEAQKKIREEFKRQGVEDLFHAYVEYFSSVYPSKELPKDAEKLFRAELDFIDYLMTGKAMEYGYNDLITKIFKGFV